MSTAIHHEHLAIEGFKKQPDGRYFARVKLSAGVVSSQQASKVADIAENFGDGTVHLTIRGNMEIHGLDEAAIPDVYREFEAVGLKLRGAMGPAVRGVSSTTVLTDGFLQGQTLARKIQDHFSGNPHFEGVPKKFKIGVEGCYQDACHLIQDICLVYSGEINGERTYDVWIGGGLGRHPMKAFLYAKHLPEKRIFCLIEAVLEIYLAEAGPGIRLKSVIKDKGWDVFVQELDQKLAGREDMTLRSGFDQHLTLPSSDPGRGKLVVPVLFGQLGAASLREIAGFAERFSGGYLALTSSQNLVLFVAGLADEMEAMKCLQDKGWLTDDMMRGINFRTCPGNQECQRGLVATGDIGSEILTCLGEKGRGLKIALSACPNSCVRPQTADFGIIAKGKEPHFDVYLRQGGNLGRVTHKNLSLEELLKVIKEIE
jgi:sulfite reductase beta subunit-like hemoprotein